METKICRECKEEKPIEEFTKHKRMKGGYDNICKECNNSKVKKWVEENPDKYGLKCKRWYRENRTKSLQESRRRYEEFVRKIQSLKNGKSCVKCGYNKHPEILHYHHRDGSKKDFIISEAINLKSSIIKNPEILQQEIDKCDLLCPNCHCELHLLERLENKKAL
jgi:hypothetical protein